MINISTFSPSARPDMTYYGSLCSAFYDLDKPEAPPEALAYYLGRATSVPGPVFEPMCGTGRYLVPLISNGCDVTGLDTSDEMLSLCRKRAAAVGCKPRLIQGHLEDFESEQSFGSVMIPSGSFSLLIDRQVVAEALRRVRSSLRPGGLFIVEVERAGRITPTLTGRWEGRWLERDDGSTIIHSWLQQYSGVEAIARSLHRYELLSGGQLIETEFQHFAVKHYEIAEFTELLACAGFSRIQCFKPYETVPPDESDDGLLFECIRS